MNEHPDLDQIVNAIRDQPIAGTGVADAAARVRERLADAAAADPPDTSGELRNCADFQRQIPALIGGHLGGSRRLLVEDHTRACVPCRRALRDAREGRSDGPATTPARVSSWPRAIAASLLIAVGLASAWFLHGGLPAFGDIATIEAIDGSVYALDSGQLTPVEVGDRIAAGRELRTAKDTRALVRLTDGSLIELDQRTTLAVTARGDDETLRLARGNIIVEAAKQHGGHLYVATADCQVSVTGTIFSVSHGTKGSRVTVIEGTVEVADDAGQHSLEPGDQVTTDPSLDKRSVAHEIAWSRRVDDYLAALGELTDIGREIRDTIAPPSPRADSAILAQVPSSTVVYAAMPNVSRSLGDAYALFRDRIAQSEVLSSWLAENGDQADEALAQMDEAVERLTEIGGYLGDEVVFTLQRDDAGEPDGVLLLAEVSDRAGLQATLDRAMTDLRTAHGDGELPFTVGGERTDLDAAVRSGADALMWVGDPLVLLGKPEEVRAIVDADGGDHLAGTPFHDRIREAYGFGVNWLFAVDVETLVATETAADQASDDADHRREVLQHTGIADLQHVIVEERSEAGQSHRRALLAFDGPRRGIASWLAAPAPMTSLELISPEATIASAFVVKDPRSMLDDLFAMFESLDPGLRDQIAELEASHDVRLRDDLAGPLGGEVAIAVDGPLLPEPSWKLILEVYDPAGLERSLHWIVEEIDQATRAEGGDGITMERAQLASATLFSLRHASRAASLYWTVSDGYLVAGPSRAVVQNALRYRDSGRNLASSSRFTELFPEDAHANFSAVLFQDAAGLLASAANALAGTRIELTPEQRDLLTRLSSGAEATLVAGYAESDRILFASTGRGGLFGFDLPTLIQLNGVFNMQDILSDLARDGDGGHHGRHRRHDGAY